MKFESVATALNLRESPGGQIVGEMRFGDCVSVATEETSHEWVKAEVTSGVSAGRTAFVRRKWLIQNLDNGPKIANLDRKGAAEVVTRRTGQFDSVKYGLGSKSSSWADLEAGGVVDCSGWVYLLAMEILAGTSANAFAKRLFTFSDEQITRVGDATHQIISGRFLKKEHFVPGTLVGVDFAEYSWDRHRPLDIDHIVAIGADSAGLFVSQSSSSGGGVNRIDLDRWLASLGRLPTIGRVHLVDLFALT